MARMDVVGDRAIIRDVHQIREGRMGRGAVIALEIVVDDGLPVGLDLVGQPAGELQPIDLGAVAAHLRLEPLGLAGQRRRLGVEVDEHEPGDLLELDLLEAELRGIEAGHLLAAARGPQAAVGVERPGVVGTGDDGLGAAAADQLVRPVRADVVERPELSVLAADHEQALVGELELVVGAGFGHLAGMARKAPAAVEDRRFLALVDPGLDVVAGMERIRPLRVGMKPVLGRRFEHLNVRHIARLLSPDRLLVRGRPAQAAPPRNRGSASRPGPGRSRPGPRRSASRRRRS